MSASRVGQFGLINMNFAIKREQSEYVATYSAIPSVSKMGEANFGRFYDPVVGRFLSPDPYVQDPGNPQNFNRYSYCLNNPLKYTDPSGESFWSAIGDACKWVGKQVAITSGIALLAGPITTTAITSYLSPNSSFGYNVQNFFSPIAVKLNGGFGSMQNGIGFDISLGVPKCTGFGYRFNWGKTYYSSNYCDYSGWETRTGGEWDLCGIFSYSGTTFDSGEISQTTNTITLGGLFNNVSYENDRNNSFTLPGVPQGDGDRYRTAAVQIQHGMISFGLNMCTGDYAKGIYIKDEEGNNIEPLTYAADGNYDPDKYRAGALYVGIGSFRIGRNSENIRNYFQNELIHSRTGDPYFKKLDIDPEWYWYFGNGSGNTLW